MTASKSAALMEEELSREEEPVKRLAHCPLSKCDGDSDSAQHAAAEW
jgi:hypothetical protein